MNLTSFLYFSSPSHLIKLCDSSSCPRRIAVRPFSAKQKSKSSVTAGRRGRERGRIGRQHLSRAGHGAQGKGRPTVLSVHGELLGNLGEVGAADKADHGLLANLLQQLEHLGRRRLHTRPRFASRSVPLVASERVRRCLRGGRASGCRRHLQGAAWSGATVMQWISAATGAG